MLTRRSFLRALGIGTGVAVVAPELLVPEPEPVRRYWQVPRNAPVGYVRSTPRFADLYQIVNEAAARGHEGGLIESSNPSVGDGSRRGDTT